VSLNLVQAQIDLQALHRWGARRSTNRHAADEGYILHGLLTGVFGKKTLQPFRLLYPKGAASASLYGYSQLDASALAQHIDEFAEPEFRDVFSSERGKPMPATFAAGRELGFDVKVRPIRRGRRENGTIGERDAFLAAALANPDKPLDRETVYRAWLEEKFAACGAQLVNDACRMASCKRVAMYRRSGADRVQGSDAIFNGNVVIQDSEKFVSMLQSGLGRHAAYGYGMVLLRPPGKPAC